MWHASLCKQHLVHRFIMCPPLCTSMSYSPYMEIMKNRNRRELETAERCLWRRIISNVLSKIVCKWVNTFLFCRTLNVRYSTIETQSIQNDHLLTNLLLKYQQIEMSGESGESMSRRGNILCNNFSKFTFDIRQLNFKSLS